MTASRPPPARGAAGFFFYVGPVRCLLLFTLLAGLAAAPAATAQESARSDSTVQALLDRLETRTLDTEQALSLLAVVIDQPERVEALGFEPLVVRSHLLGPNHLGGHGSDEPRTPVARAFQAYREGDVSRGDSLFEHAIKTADSDRQRAYFLYSRASTGFGNPEVLIDSALAYDPTHGPSLYRRAGQGADRIGRPPTVEGRAAYWCLADEYRRVAEATDDERIAHAARTAASRYDAAAPTAGQAEAAGWRAGQTVTVEVADGETCTTAVR